MVTISNLTYNIHDEDYTVIDKVNKHLESLLYLLMTATKSESGITIRPKKDANRFERIVYIPKKEQPKFQKELDLPTAKK